MSASRSEKPPLEQTPPNPSEASEQSAATDPSQNVSENGLTRLPMPPPAVEEPLPSYNTGLGNLGVDDVVDDVPPPAYSESYAHFSSEQEGLNTDARVASDGRVNIRITEKSRRLSYVLGPALREQLRPPTDDEPPPPPYIPPSLGGEPGKPPPPSLNIVIHVVGSRGDVQPFVALGKVLKDTYQHRVRLATHPTFQKFVEENGLEFFSISGDPSELMAFMVKNPGLMPGFDTLRRGDVGRRRKNIAEMIRGCWRSCIETGDGLGPEPAEDHAGIWMESTEGVRPFVADAIIANPPSFAHVHCAEKMGVPLHIMFTMPWSPTQAFPHPLANVQSSNTDSSMSNFMSYLLVDVLTWQGLGDVINRFRVHSLGLEPLSRAWAPGLLARVRVPHTYCWSPALIEKPRDWPSHIQISGFFFLNLASNYTPAPDLAEFLDAGPPPVYIGFGSIVIDDPSAMTKLIFEAVKKTGQRALVSQGWGGLGADELGKPDEVFMLGNCPHDWLFKRVSCTVIHGGAGTVAASLFAGRPTVVVPFFGDQPFWGAMIARAGAGPAPIPHKQLTAENLAEAIMQALKPESQERAQEIADKISHEKGSDVGAQSFHQMLNVDNLRCAVAPSRVAVWRIRRTKVKLSALAATVLSNAGFLTFNDLKLYRAKEYTTDEGPWDPITGATSALMGTMSSVMMGVADFPIETLKALKIHPDTHKKRRKTESTGEASSPGPSRTQSLEGANANLSTTSLASGTNQSSSSLVTANSAASAPTDASLQPIASRESNDSSLTAGSTQLTPTESGTSTVEDRPTGSPRPQASSPGSPSQRQHSSMAQALQDASGRSRSRSRSRPGSRSGSPSRGQICGTRVADHIQSNRLDAAMGTGKGIGRIIGAGMKSPMDFSLAISKGFHNLPKLYGEEVRTVDKITGVNSGMKTAAKELGLGVYDGISGIFTQPVKLAKTEGAVGFAKGVGRGLAGAFIKPSAGVWAVPAYLYKGVYKEIQNNLGNSTESYIIASRITEGFALHQTCSEEEKRDIVQQWSIIKRDMKKKAFVGEEQLDALQAKLTKHEEKKKAEKSRRKEEKAKKKAEKATLKKPSKRTFSMDLPEPFHGTAGSSSSDSVRLPPPRQGSSSSAMNAIANNRATSPAAAPLYGSTVSEPPYANLAPVELSASADVSAAPEKGRQDLSHYHDSDSEDEMGKAIRLSKADTSKDEEEEDAMIKRAIRASAAEIERSHVEGYSDEEALQRAIDASIAEAPRDPANGSAPSGEYAKELEEAIRISMLEHRHRRPMDSHGGPSSSRGLHRVKSSDSEWDSSSVDSMDPEEEELRLAIEASKLNSLGSADDLPGSPPPYDATATSSKDVPASFNNAEAGDPVLARPAGSISQPVASADTNADADLKRALEASAAETTERERAAEAARREEEIVLAYIQRQSLAEEEHRQALLAAAADGDDARTPPSDGDTVAVAPAETATAPVEAAGPSNGDTVTSAPDEATAPAGVRERIGDDGEGVRRAKESKSAAGSATHWTGM